MLPARRAKQKCLDASTRRKKKTGDLGLHDTSFGKDRPTDCSICLEKVAVRGKLGVCNHWFCFQCIFEWSKMTNTCPLCKLRFRCITKINLDHWASPAKQFRIQDKDQSLDVTAEDAELAMELENEESMESDQNDSDYTLEYQEPSNADYFYYEDSFIDDTDLSPHSTNFSLGHYLQRVNSLTRSPYTFRSSRRDSNVNFQSASEEVRQTEQTVRHNGRERRPQTRQSANLYTAETSESDRPSLATTGSRRRRRQHLNYSEERGAWSRRSTRSTRARNATRPSATVSGWINMAQKNSHRDSTSNAEQHSSQNSSTEDSSSDEESDSQEIHILQRKPKKTRYVISSDEEEQDEDSDVTEIDFDEDRCRSPCIVSSPNSTTPCTQTSTTPLHSNDEEAFMEPRSPSVVSSQSSADVVRSNYKSKYQKTEESKTRISPQRQTQSNILCSGNVAKDNGDWIAWEESSENKKHYLRSSVRDFNQESKENQSRRRSKRTVSRPDYSEICHSEKSDYSDHFSAFAEQRKSNGKSHNKKTNNHNDWSYLYQSNRNNTTRAPQSTDENSAATASSNVSTYTSNELMGAYNFSQESQGNQTRPGSKRAVSRPDYSAISNYHSENSDNSDDISAFVAQSKSHGKSHNKKKYNQDDEACLYQSNRNENTKASHKTDETSTATASSYVSTYTGKESLGGQNSTASTSIYLSTYQDPFNGKENSESGTDDWTTFRATRRTQMATESSRKRQKRDNGSVLSERRACNVEHKGFRFRKVTASESHLTNHASSTTASESNFSASSDEDSSTAYDEELLPRGIFAPTPQEKPRFRTISQCSRKARRIIDLPKLL